jgi:valyl-tRNA synthetase
LKTISPNTALPTLLLAVYKLIWDDFCSWYLEMIKPAYQQPIDRKSYEQTIEIFEKILKVLQPFMPFISEEIYQHIKKEGAAESIMIAMTPKVESFDEVILDKFDFAAQVVMAIVICVRKRILPTKTVLICSSAKTMMTLPILHLTRW